MCFINARSRFLVGEITVLRRSDLGDLPSHQSRLSFAAKEILTSSPDIESLILSTPSLTWCLMTSLISSGPSANAVMPATSSPSRRAISLPLAKYRGPGISPALIASRMTMSSRSFAAAAPKHLYNSQPHINSVFAVHGSPTLCIQSRYSRPHSLPSRAYAPQHPTHLNDRDPHHSTTDACAHRPVPGSASFLVH
jgi:hypothetical protein